MGLAAALIPGLDREEPDLWIEDDIPTPEADAAEEGENGLASDPPRERDRDRERPRENPRE